MANIKIYALKLKIRQHSGTKFLHKQFPLLMYIHKYVQCTLYIYIHKYVYTDKVKLSDRFVKPFTLVQKL